MDIIRRVFFLVLILFICVNAEEEILKKEVFISELMEVITEIKKTSFAGDDIAVRVPNSMIIAQGGLESNYGESNIAKTKENYFGMLNSKGNYAKFRNLNEAVEAYLKNISTNPVYKKFQVAIKKGEKSPHKLLSLIEKVYSNNSKDYAKKIKDIIRQNNLTRFDEDSVKIAYDNNSLKKGVPA